MVKALATLAQLKEIALSRIPIRGSLPRNSVALNTYQFASFTEYLEWSVDNASVIAQWEQEDVDAAPQGDSNFTITGYCALCQSDVDFEIDTNVRRTNSAGESIPNFRELLSCPNCRMCNRVRAALHVTVQDPDVTLSSRIYTTEQLGRVYRWLSGRFRNVQGSEYISPGKPSGSRVWGINHQDVQSLSLPEGSIDCIITFDVLEHVPDHQAALASFAKVLKPGGKLVMTVPFHIDTHETTVRAVMHDDGQIEHILPIEMHGNPLDPAGGSLSFRTFGWDLLDQIVTAGFSQARVLVYHDKRLGHLGGAQSLFMAVR